MQISCIFGAVCQNFHLHVKEPLEKCFASMDLTSYPIIGRFRGERRNVAVEMENFWTSITAIQGVSTVMAQRTPLL